MKTITLNFAIPDDVDTPSETLLKMRDLLLGALAHGRTEHADEYTDEERALIDALLTES